ncbi:uncharacterized protein LOC111625583 [Centruroides sculpturatus]|uniref:uncharacterized protein LOC111625583 n=1 Tax=Centruroides sculpturatus TaxID=218467 RepID=UPI000C6CB859|nr:uncharacterized protein LOC111625583 [Centruroides sculpturatus]
MSTSMNVKLILVLFTFMAALLDINCIIPQTPEEACVHLDTNLKNYCKLDLTKQKDIRSCFVENGIQMNLEFAKICVNKQKHLQTLGEISDYICCILEKDPEKYKELVCCYSSLELSCSKINPAMYSTIDACLYPAVVKC